QGREHAIQQLGADLVIRCGFLPRRLSLLPVGGRPCLKDRLPQKARVRAGLASRRSGRKSLRDLVAKRFEGARDANTMQSPALALAQEIVLPVSTDEHRFV